VEPNQAEKQIANQSMILQMFDPAVLPAGHKEDGGKPHQAVIVNAEVAGGSARQFFDEPAEQDVE
jgi:hypothetical protein